MNTIEDLERQNVIPAVVADHHGFITGVNASFCQLFGWQRHEIVGQPLTCIIPKAMHDAHHLGFSRYIATGKPTLLNQPLKLTAVTKDGREIEAEHIITAEQRNGHWMFAATIRPLA